MQLIDSLSGDYIFGLAKGNAVLYHLMSFGLFGNVFQSDGVYTLYNEEKHDYIFFCCTIKFKIYWDNAQYQQKKNTTSESKALLTTFRREASLSDLSFGLG